ncbi:MAG: hypothetical protein QCI82_00655, partial [Candidatus Thermoplasmatota archaeon]|nr:hypothetical protein [Candidatus Thermoplasmatota archaeon]
MQKDSIARKNIVIILELLLISVTVTGLVSLSDGTSDLTHTRSYTGLHIDLNIYDDATSDRDYISIKDQRMVRFNDISKSGDTMSIEIGKESIRMEKIEFRD